MKVRNMTSSNGRAVPNQFIIYDKGDYYFQSYDTVIAKADYAGRVTIIEGACDFSRTTSKYLYSFLQNFSLIVPEAMSKKGLAKLVESGKIFITKRFN